MAGLTHPQKRATSAVRSMLTGDKREQASEWLSRGWNPFLPHPASRGYWCAPVPMEMMLDSQGQWSHWINEEAVKLAPLAQAAFGGKGAPLDSRMGLVSMAATHYGGQALGALLAMGFDPNEPEPYSKAPPLHATRSLSVAQALLDAGADPLRRDAKGNSWWETWAQNHCYGGAPSLSDLDWVAKHCPPGLGPEPHEARNLARAAIGGGKLGLLSRLLAVGIPKSALDDPDMGAQVRGSQNQADRPAVLSAYIQVLGPERTLNAFLETPPQPDSRPIWSKRSNESALLIAMDRGNVESLNLMLGAGLLAREPAPKLLDQAMSLWCRQATQKEESVGVGRALLWAARQLDASDPEHARAASRALGACAAVGLDRAAPLGELLARKGLVPVEGAGSISEAFDGGAYWESEKEAFGAFKARCERAEFRNELPQKKAAPTRAKPRI